MNPDFCKPGWVVQRSKYPFEANQLLQVDLTFNAVLEADVQGEASQRLYRNDTIHHEITPMARWPHGRVPVRY